MNEEHNMKKEQPLFTALKNIKLTTNTKIFAAIAVVGVALILLGNFGNADSNREVENQTALLDEDTYNQQYIANTEARLTDIIQSIEGVGEVKVMVTLETGVEYVYASEQKQQSDQNGAAGVTDSFSQKNSSETSIIIVDTPSGKQAITVKRIEPTILGVAVVCEGGDNIYVKQSVIDTISSVLGITTNRISVNKMG